MEQSFLERPFRKSRSTSRGFPFFRIIWNSGNFLFHLTFIAVTHSTPISFNVRCPRQDGWTCCIESIKCLMLHFIWFAVFLEIRVSGWRRKYCSTTRQVGRKDQRGKRVSQHLGISEIQTGIFAPMDHALEIQWLPSEFAPSPVPGSTTRLHWPSNGLPLARWDS